MWQWIRGYFDIEGRGTTVAREARGACATFLTMVYIVVVNPRILEAGGVPFDSAVACTAAAAGLCCILMGLGANFPIALASGMGLNAVVAALPHLPGVGNWQTAMGLVMLDGVVVVVLVLCGLREKLLHAIPLDLRRALGASIGLFIAFIGLVNARLVVVPAFAVDVLKESATAIVPPVTAGPLHRPEAWVAGVGLLVTALLLARRIPGAMIVGIAAGTATAFGLGLTRWPTEWHAPSFANFGQADVRAACSLQLLPLLFALVVVDFFDTLGGVTALAEQAGLQDERGRIPGVRRILLFDGFAATVGGLFGVSSITSYIESAAGVAEGARTGLHSVLVGLLFLLTVLLAPLAGVVPAAATAPALVLIGLLMAAQLARIDFSQLDTAIPAFLTLITVPFTLSIAHGIGFGFVAFVLLRLARGCWRDIHPLMAGAAGSFVLYFVLESSR